MPSITMSRLQCADCGAEAVEKCGVVQPCRCGSPSRKFEPDHEAQARMEAARASRYRSALAQLVQAVEGLDDSALPWAVLAALHEAKQAMKGEA